MNEFNTRKYCLKWKQYWFDYMTLVLIQPSKSAEISQVDVKRGRIWVDIFQQISPSIILKS